MSDPSTNETSTPANVDRAMHALDVCASVAERGEWLVAPEAAPADFLAVEPAELRDAFERVLMSRHPEEGLDALLACGALHALMPEVKAMVGFGDGEWRHKDVWKHTKQVVRQAVPRTEVRWAALLHDIGKVKTRSISPDGEVHFFGHAEVGARMFDKLQRRTAMFKGADALRDTVRFLILHHLRASQYDREWTDSAVRRFSKEIGATMCDLLDLSRADITTKRPEKKRRGLEMISELAERVRQVQALDAKLPPLPKGLGTALSDALGIPPSRRLGEIMKLLADAAETGAIEARQPIEYYVEFARAEGLAEKV